MVKASSSYHSPFTIYHSLVKDSLAHVTFGAVGEERDDALARAEAFGDSPGRGGGRAGRAAAEDAFGARQLPHGGESLRVRDGDDLVGRVAVEVRRDELTLADAFEAVGAGLPAPQYRAFGLDEHAEDLRVDLLDGVRDARERAGRAAAQNQSVNLSARL